MAVLDTSILLAVLLGESTAIQAEAALSDAPVDVPDIVSLEVANALVNGVRRGRIVESEAGPRLAMAERIVATWHPSRPLVGRATDIALAYQRRPYDGIFIALAETLDTEVLTLDQKLVRGLEGTPLQHRVRLLAG